jgi:AcrR family transcriptional regulator
MTSRRYELKRRAEEQERTRRRIIDAVVSLHEEVGPARTTIVGVAKRAHVSRPTVYAHFPDEDSLIRACSADWAARNPMPEVSAWATIEDTRRRLRVALAELYGYYARRERMLGNVLRDALLMPSVAAAVDSIYGPYAEEAVAVLALSKRRRTLATLHLALDFRTWEALTAAGRLADGEAAELMADLVECA